MPSAGPPEPLVQRKFARTRLRVFDGAAHVSGASIQRGWDPPSRSISARKPCADDTTCQKRTGHAERDPRCLNQSRRVAHAQEDGGKVGAPGAGLRASCRRPDSSIRDVTAGPRRPNAEDER
eukprot:1401264-Rhodomonas_salina.2